MFKPNFSILIRALDKRERVSWFGSVLVVKVRVAVRRRWTVRVDFEGELFHARVLSA